MSALLRFAAKKRVPFVEDPFAYKWSSATISGDVVLGSDAFSTAYELCTRSTWKIDPAAPFTVVGHGTPSMMIVNTQMHPKALSQANLKILKEKGEVMLNAMQLARLIRTAPGYNKGQHIHLFSCETGARADGLAQRWATRMGQQVSAFTENVHIFYDKPLFVTYCKATEKAGMVKTFYPQTGMSKVIASSLLLAGCDSSAENPVATYDDLMKEYAYEQQEKRQRSLFDRIVNPEMHPVIKETSKIIQAAVADLFDIFKNTPVDSRRRIPFVEDPKRGTWNKACISGDLILSSQEDAAGYLHVKKGWDKDKRCPFNVVAHGSPSHVQVANRDIHPNALALAHSIVLREEGSVMLNAAELKQVIETAPGYEKGQDVHLYSCKCGAEVEGIAQQLADEMQVRVSAFTADAVTYDYPIGFGFFTAGDAETGFKEIKTFYPRDPGEPRQRRISNIH
jgi:hypothetical protein